MGFIVNRRHTPEQDFLPAVLEVMEKPPSPAGRAITWTLMLVSGCAVLWACLGRVDIVTVAHGKIVPSGRIRAIQAAELGVVRYIHVAEGDSVEAGELLLELDPSMSEADQVRISEALQALRMERDRQQLFSDVLNGVADLKPAPRRVELDRSPGDKADASDVDLQNRILANQWSEFRASRAAMEKALEANREERNGVHASLGKYRAILPLVTERAAASMKLADRDLLPRVQWIEQEQERVEIEKEIGVLRHNLLRLEADADRIQQEFAEQEAHLQVTIHSRLVELGRGIVELEQELVKARSLTRRQRLTAPVSGTVHRLSVNTIGGVVKPAEPLMYIVPREDGLEVEAWVRNRDIGYIELEQATAIKVETFPFTRYGTLPGRVSAISRDAVENADHGLVYRVKVIPEDTYIRRGERSLKLVPGMAVTAEVMTGRRRLIEFLMSPLLRYKNEFARER